MFFYSAFNKSQSNCSWVNLIRQKKKKIDWKQLIHNKNEGWGMGNIKNTTFEKCKNK